MVELLKVQDGSIVETTETKDWYAWINFMPPPPNDFHTVGSVLVGNPGIKAILTPRVPQGINPAILLLDLVLVQQPGYWPQVMTWIEARYDKVVPGSPYTMVQIFSGDEAIAEVQVEEVH